MHDFYSHLNLLVGRYPVFERHYYSTKGLHKIHEFKAVFSDQFGVMKVVEFNVVTDFRQFTDVKLFFRLFKIRNNFHPAFKHNVMRLTVANLVLVGFHHTYTCMMVFVRRQLRRFIRGCVTSLCFKLQMLVNQLSLLK